MPIDVPIDRKPRHSERVTQDDVRRLASDPGKLGQRIHVGWDLTAVLSNQGTRHTEQRL